VVKGKLPREVFAGFIESNGVVAVLDNISPLLLAMDNALKSSSSDWESYKKSSNYATLRDFVEGRIKQNKLDFYTMFRGIDPKQFTTSDLKYLRSVASKYEQDFSIVINDVRDFFDPDTPKRYPSPSEVDPSTRLTQDTLDIYDDHIHWIKKIEKDDDWDSVKEMPSIKSSLNEFLDSKFNMGVTKISSYFTEENKNVLSQYIRSLRSKYIRKFEDYDDLLNDDMVVKKTSVKSRFLDSTADQTSKHRFSNQNSSVLVPDYEIRDIVVKNLSKLGYKKISSFIYENKISLDRVSSILKDVSVEFPNKKYLIDCIHDDLGLYGQ
jgi:hypothetical protein